jgi:hypothetical protein
VIPLLNAFSQGVWVQMYSNVPVFLIKWYWVNVCTVLTGRRVSSAKAQQLDFKFRDENNLLRKRYGMPW